VIQNRFVELLGYATRALRREVFQFRFEYPLEIIAEAGPKDSLHYYFYSEKLSWSLMSMDDAGIPQARLRIPGTVYKPAYIAWWGLVNLGHFLRHGDEKSRSVFINQVNWLESQAVTRADGAVVWPNRFDCLQGNTFLKAPWVSAYDQGLAISALVRGYRLTKKPHLLELLKNASKIFELDVCQSGVRVSSGKQSLFMELPGGPSPGILDGFMTSLLGLYDLFVETGEPTAKRLFTEGIEGLKTALPAWNYRNKWSWYGAHAYLCPPAYHHLNRVLLNVLARLSSQPSLGKYAEAWNTDYLSILDRLEIFAGFLFTKNACRIRHRTWTDRQGRAAKLAAGSTCPAVQEVAGPV
jgi:heparosan-N-sulfate-glucuronate 5-epimerase